MVEMLHLHHAVVALPVIVALGFAAQVIASHLKIPAILPLLLIGFVVGPITHLIHPSDSLGKDGLSLLTSLAIAVILFEGGLTLKFSDIAGHGRAVRRLISLGAVLTWVLAAVAAHFITGLSWGLSVLFGALVIVTGPTVIAPLLRNIRPNAQVAGVLRWEGILIDPIGALAAALAFEWVRSGINADTFAHSLSHMMSFIGVGTLLGVVMGGLLVWALKREVIPDELVNPGVLAWVLLAFGLSDAFAPESGLLTVTIMGIWLANAKLAKAEEVLHFKEELVVILLSTIFVALAANISPEALKAVFQPAPMLLLLAIILLVRPLSVLGSTIGTNLTIQERLFISYIGPRGIVAAAISALFASRLAQSETPIPGADELVTLVFAVIVGTVILASLTAKPVAKWLGVTEADPHGFLIVGAHRMGRQLAKVLKEEEVDILLADTNRENIHKAKMQGLSGFYGSLLSKPAEDLSLEGLGNLLALTSNDEANILSARKYQREFGKKNVFQLEPETTTKREGFQEEQRAPSAFQHKPSYSQLEDLYLAGARIKRTNLTENYTMKDFLADQPRSLILLYGKKGVFEVATEENNPPESDITLIVLSIEEPKQKEKHLDQKNNQLEEESK